MALILERLRELRAGRRSTIRALSSLREEQLTVRVGPGPGGDVRAVLLSLAQDDDRRCAVAGAIFDALQWRPTEAHRICASLALTRGQLRGALVGLGDAYLDRPPAPEEWSVRQTLRHVMNNENQFIADSARAVESLRSGLPPREPESRNPPGSLGPEVPGDGEDVLRALEGVRDEVVGLSASLTDEELGAPMVWAGMPVDVRFVLHRRATHERQHTAQIGKTLQALGWRPTEAQMILGQAEMARSALEGVLQGVPDPLVDRSPSGGLASVGQMLLEAHAQEEAKVAAILGVLA